MLAIMAKAAARGVAKRPASQMRPAAQMRPRARKRPAGMMGAAPEGDVLMGLAGEEEPMPSPGGSSQTTLPLPGALGKPGDQDGVGLLGRNACKHGAATDKAR